MNIVMAHGKRLHTLFVFIQRQISISFFVLVLFPLCWLKFLHPYFEKSESLLCKKMVDMNEE